MINKNSLFSFFWMVFIASFILFLYVPKLTSYTLSGDDLFLIDNAPRNINQIFNKFLDFSGQYRPLTHNLFIVYRAILPNIWLILVTNLIIMISISGLLYINLKRLVKPWLAAILSIAVMMSPIFYYHFFAIAALNNQLILIFTLLLFSMVKIKDKVLLNFRPKTNIVIGFIFLLLAIFSKESFLVTALLYYILLHQNLLKKEFIRASILTSAILVIYFILHFAFYHKNGGDYSLGNSTNNAINMALDMGMWIIGYPRGWQYGAANPKTWLTYMTAFISFLSLGLIFIEPKKVLKKWKDQILFLLAFCLSIAPFFVIDRALVFYLDSTIIILVFWFAYNIKYQLFFLPLIISFILQFYLYYPQWHQYSFVANANKVVANYHNALIKNNFMNYKIICIINNDRGGWGSKDGQAAKLIYSYKGLIINTKKDQVPTECNDQSLVLRNDGWDYKKFP